MSSAPAPVPTNASPDFLDLPERAAGVRGFTRGDLGSLPDPTLGLGAAAVLLHHKLRAELPARGRAQRHEIDARAHADLISKLATQI